MMSATTTGIKISIVILQFNNSEDVISCLESVKELKSPDFDVVVVDNASLPEHQQNIKKYLNSQQNYLPTIRCQLLDTNYGYSGGNNVGIKYALERGAEYVLILNPDVRVESDLLNKLIAKAESDSKIGIVGPAIMEMSGSTAKNLTVEPLSKRIIHGGRIKWLKPELQHLESYNPQRSLNDYMEAGTLTKMSGLEAKNCYIVGSSMFVKREVFDKIGFFDERYFLYFEDADFNVRAQKAGFKLAVELNASVYHKVSSSTRTLGSVKLLYYHYRNAHLFNIKNGPLWVKVLLPFWSFYVILKQLAKTMFMPSKRNISKAILRGIFDFYRGRFGPA